MRSGMRKSEGGKYYTLDIVSPEGWAEQTGRGKVSRQNAGLRPGRRKERVMTGRVRGHTWCLNIGLCLRRAVMRVSMPTWVAGGQDGSLGSRWFS